MGKLSQVRCLDVLDVADGLESLMRYHIANKDFKAAAALYASLDAPNEVKIDLWFRFNSTERRLMKHENTNKGRG